MLINTDRCVGCDDCVRACASTHNSNPRFIRHGPSHGNIQVANACMHCVDPVCLIGCPTGAIARNFADGHIMIDDRICIGCGTCANSCPYNNIQLVEIRDQNGTFVVDAETKQPIVKATKCDLCYGQLGGPACERACPHDALIRIDMHDQEGLAAWVNRS
jgi:Fe-S-cluster-containing dehydrogenase component